MQKIHKNYQVNWFYLIHLKKSLILKLKNDQ